MTGVGRCTAPTAVARSTPDRVTLRPGAAPSRSHPGRGLVAPADADLAEPRVPVEPPRDHVAGADLEEDGPRPGRPAFGEHGLEEHAPEAAAAVLGMDGDVEHVHLVGHPP